MDCYVYKYVELCYGDIIIIMMVKNLVMVIKVTEMVDDFMIIGSFHFIDYFVFIYCFHISLRMFII